MLPLAGGMYLGWALGANDAANVFGTAVASRIITLKNAAMLCAFAVILGAILQGQRGIQTLSALTNQTHVTLLIIAMSAAVTITLTMGVLKLPMSTSQAIIGAITGVGLATGDMQWAGLVKVVSCWVATVPGAMIVAIIIYKLMGMIFNRVPMSILTRDKLLWGGLILVGTYGSYALGANNVANATGIFSGKIGLTDQQLAMVGGISIALGVLSYSRRMMMSLGTGIMKLDAYTAFVAVLAMAITVNVFAIIGVPVSTSQAIVGAIIGVGLAQGVHTLKLHILRRIGAGWFITPGVAMILSAAAYAIANGAQ